MADSTVIASSPSTKGDVAISVPSSVILRSEATKDLAQDKLRDRRISVVGGNAVHSSTSSE